MLFVGQRGHIIWTSGPRVQHNKFYVIVYNADTICNLQTTLHDRSRGGCGRFWGLCRQSIDSWKCARLPSVLVEIWQTNL